MNPTEARKLAEEMKALSAHVENLADPRKGIMAVGKVHSLADALLAALDENERLRKAAEKGEEGFWESLYKRAGV